MRGCENEIDRLIRNMDGELMASFGGRREAILLRKMFQNACGVVRIFSRGLSSPAYKDGQLMDDIRLYLASGGSLHIVVEEAIPEESPFWVLLRDFPDLVALVRLDMEMITKEPPFHFIVVDDSIYRFEGDRSETAAIAAFGDDKYASRLVGVFDALCSCSGQPLEIGG